MSKRMDVHELAGWVAQTPEDVWREVQRARRSEDEKDTQIKALADVLERLWNFSAPRAKTEALWPQVEAALRLCGRLP